MKRIFIFIFSTVIMLSAASSFAEQKQQDMISVRIVPTNSRDVQRSISLNPPNEHFHVVVTNVAGQPLRLWREWCSWGYSTISFQVTDENGEITVVKKVPGAWRKNSPDWVVLQPGDSRVYEISLDPKIWLNTDSVLPEAGKSRKVKIRVIFEIPEDKETKEYNVWIGKVYSPEQVYTIYR